MNRKPTQRGYHADVSQALSQPQPGGQAALLPRSHTRALAACVALAFAVLAGQLVRLALDADRSRGIWVSVMSASAGSTYARPDIIDRAGRLLATDVQVPSLYADPTLVQDVDEAAEKLAGLFPELDQRHLRASLGDRSRRFVWLKRALAPAVAQRVHNFGLPGLAFVDEVRRTYPAGELGGHILGRVDIDNRAVSGIERFIDEIGAAQLAVGARLSARAPLRLSLDLGVMHALEDELNSAMRRYQASGAAGIIMHAKTGEIAAAVSLPGVDPARAADGLDSTRIDKLLAGTYELGSVMKFITVAMAIEDGARLDSLVDTAEPLTAGRFTIRDLYPLGRPMTLAEVFVRSSNVGAGQLALSAGADRQRAFLENLGLFKPIVTEAGPSAPPQLPKHWGRAEQITISYGHGMAISPLQFTAAAASLLNGGVRVRPTFLAGGGTASGSAEGGVRVDRVVRPETSAKLGELMRLNVTDPAGTGRRADVAGYDVGGKTGTAEMARRGRYQAKSVISSFLGVFPARDPAYVTFVMLFEPNGSADTDGEITAGRNAAPTTARIIARIAPLLQVAASPTGS